MWRGRSATPSWRRPRSTPASPSIRSATSRARWSGWASTSRADRRPPDHGRMARPRLEVADVFRAHGAAWRKANASHVSLGQLKVMSAIETCRTSALGGHVERCEDARTNASPTIPAATATARSVRRRRRSNGSKNVRRSFSPPQVDRPERDAANCGVSPNSQITSQSPKGPPTRGRRNSSSSLLDDEPEDAAR